VRELLVAPGGLRGCAADGEGESWLWLVATLALSEEWCQVCRAAGIFIAGAFRHVVVALGERRRKRAFFFVKCLFIHFLGPGNKVAGLF